MHTDNRKKDILVLGQDPTDRLDDTTITAETKYSLNIANSKKKKKIFKSELQWKKQSFVC